MKCANCTQNPFSGFLDHDNIQTETTVNFQWYLEQQKMPKLSKMTLISVFNLPFMVRYTEMRWSGSGSDWRKIYC